MSKILRYLLCLTVLISLLLIGYSNSSIGSQNIQLPLSEIKAEIETPVPAAVSIETPNALSTSPFLQFESWESDETGLFTDGNQIRDTLKPYGLLEKISAEIYADYSDDFEVFGACTAKIDGFTIGSKKAALLLIQQGHLHIYIMFSNNGEVWVADGFAYQSERYEPQYRIEKSGDGARYWLVLKHESNHGSGLQLFDEIWHNPDGSIAAQYPLSGSSAFLPVNIADAWGEYSSDPYFDGESTIIVDYTIKFYYNYKHKFQSAYLLVIRERWNYDLNKSQFSLVESSSELPENFDTIYDGISMDDYGILGRYIEFYEEEVGEKNVSSIGDWEKLMESK